MGRWLCVLIGAMIALSALAASADAPSRVRLIFSLDQGFGNGVVANDDSVALLRIIRALRPLQDRYDVYLLVNPQVKDQGKLNHLLDFMVTQKMPFVFDVYSSDSYTLGANCANCRPYDASHGISISIDDLKAYKARYGSWLAGLRFMEVFGQDFTVRAIKTTNPEWARPGDKLPKDNVFQPAIAERYIRFARDNGMFLDWSDFHWYEFKQWDAPQKRYEEQVCALLRKYPGVVTTTYDNNEPGEDSAKRLANWQNAVAKFSKDGAAGFGLSDQSWLRADHMKCPPEEIVTWAQDAIKKGAHLVQFEPVWYFFKLPVGSFEAQDYTKDPQWLERGEPRESFGKLVEGLVESSVQTSSGT